MDLKYERQNSKASRIYNTEHLHDLEVEENFLNRTQKVLAMQETINKSGIKSKNLYLSKNYEECEKTSTEWERISAIQPTKGSFTEYVKSYRSVR